MQTTNNRMELLAAIRGLNGLREPCVVTLYSDSTYVIGIGTGHSRAVRYGISDEEAWDVGLACGGAIEPGPAGDSSAMPISPALP